MSDDAHPRLTGRVVTTVRDEVASWPVVSTTEHYRTDYVSLAFEEVRGPDGATHGRAVVRPNGAVGILALDDDDRVLLVQQYRHAVGRRLVELPAGTLDVAGETPQRAAARELAEEADVRAEHWTRLLSTVVTPGYSTETWEVFLATGLQPVDHAERTVREAEEADMEHWWLPFDDAVAAVLDGRISDTMTGLGLLAEVARRRA